MIVMMIAITPSLKASSRLDFMRWRRMPHWRGIAQRNVDGTSGQFPRIVMVMKLALFGASGMIGSRILSEALRRGHVVTAVVRDPAKFGVRHKNLTVVKGDVLDADSIAAAVKGHEAVLSAVGASTEVIRS